MHDAEVGNVIQSAPAASVEQRSCSVGRARSTTADALSRIGLDLFINYGFDHVTVEDIAAEAGIGRRTFFRYFPSKKDLAWGDFDTLLADMCTRFREVPGGTTLFNALREVVIDFNRFPEQEVPLLRQRMECLLKTPSLVAHSALRYQAWRRVVSRFAAQRLDVGRDSHIATTLGQVCLGISICAYEEWLEGEELDLADLIDQGFHDMRRVFSE